MQSLSSQLWNLNKTIFSGVEQSPFYGINLEDPDGPTKIRIPFAVWNMGPDPSNTADDYQMVVIVTDANENNIFDFWQIQSKEGSVVSELSSSTYSNSLRSCWN